VAGETCSCWQEEGSSIAAAFGPPRAKDGKISPLASRPLTGQRAKREDDEREDSRSVRRRERGGRPELSGAMERRDSGWTGPSARWMTVWCCQYFFSFNVNSLLLLRAPVQLLEARFASAPQAACPARTSSGKCPGEAPGAARASGTERRRYGHGDANRTRLCTLLGSSTSSKLSANPLQAYQSTVWPNRDGLLGLGRPPSSLNRTCIRAQGVRRLVARTAWPYCTWGGGATVCALSRPLKVKVPSPRPL
jgi:hypothetical protein